MAKNSNKRSVADTEELPQEGVPQEGAPLPAGDEDDDGDGAPQGQGRGPKTDDEGFSLPTIGRVSFASLGLDGATCHPAVRYAVPHGLITSLRQAQANMAREVRAAAGEVAKGNAADWNAATEAAGVPGLAVTEDAIVAVVTALTPLAHKERFEDVLKGMVRRRGLRGPQMDAMTRHMYDVAIERLRAAPKVRSGEVVLPTKVTELRAMVDRLMGENAGFAAAVRAEAGRRVEAENALASAELAL